MKKKKKMLSTRPFNMQHAIPTAKVIIKQANQTSKSNKRDLLHKTDNQGLKSHTTVHFIYNSCFHSIPNFLSGKNFLTTLYLQTNTTHTRKRKKNITCWNSMEAISKEITMIIWYTSLLAKGFNHGGIVTA